MDNELDSEKKRVLYEQFLRCLDREENLIHYRTTWGMQWNAAAFASLIGLNNLPKIDDRLYLVVTIIVVGSALCASILSALSIDAAHMQTDYLIKSLNRRLGFIKDEKIEKLGDDDQAKWLDSIFLRPYGEFNTVHRNARLISRFIPLIFSLVWFLIFGYLIIKNYILL